MNGLFILFCFCIQPPTPGFRPRQPPQALEAAQVRVEVDVEELRHEGIIHLPLGVEGSQPLGALQGYTCCSQLSIAMTGPWERLLRRRKEHRRFAMTNGRLRRFA
jgi:hypothetical protein